MAVQEKMALNTGSDLDSLIHSLEYENQQYVKMIEKENQRIQYLEAQEQEKTQAITELQTCLTNLELDTKNNHRQLVHNKNTLESLKKTKTVLQAHRDALQKQLEMLQFENDEQRREFEETIQLYEKTWTDYDAIYKSLPLYKTLLESESRLAESEAEHTKWQRQKNELNRKMQATRDEMDFRDWQRFCIRIADKWLSSRRKKKEFMDAVVEKETLQAKMEEIRGKNNSSLNTTGLPETSQDMDTDDTQTETSPDLTSSEENVTEQDTTLTERGAGDGGDFIATSLTGTQKYYSFSLLFLLLLCVVIEWIFERSTAENCRLRPYTCPLHIY
ncbi:spindle assembly abnormal protein 6 homolog [Littorina saxatilis]|uniref:Uncharacterized protein n=1 Tax=Littorina saxatilis TaxID=31220 RepID=A0AAN9AWD2_9CAEN